MTDRESIPLGASAFGYINGMGDRLRREAARDYARMPSDEFQARMGVAVDDIQRELTAISLQLSTPSGGFVVRYAQAFEQSSIVKILTMAVSAGVASAIKIISDTK